MIENNQKNGIIFSSKHKKNDMSEHEELLMLRALVAKKAQELEASKRILAERDGFSAPSQSLMPFGRGGKRLLPCTQQIRSLPRCLAIVRTRENILKHFWKMIRFPLATIIVK